VPGVVNGDPTGGLAAPDDAAADDTTKVGDPVIDPSLAPSAGSELTGASSSGLNQAGGTRAPDSADPDGSAGAQPSAARTTPVATRVTDAPN
jgi:hypothetical protein